MKGKLFRLNDVKYELVICLDRPFSIDQKRLEFVKNKRDNIETSRGNLLEKGDKMIQYTNKLYLIIPARIGKKDNKLHFCDPKSVLYTQRNIDARYHGYRLVKKMFFPEPSLKNNRRNKNLSYFLRTVYSTFIDYEN